MLGRAWESGGLKWEYYNNWVTEKETEFEGQKQEWKKKWIGSRILLIKYDNYIKGKD